MFEAINLKRFLIGLMLAAITVLAQIAVVLLLGFLFASTSGLLSGVLFLLIMPLLLGLIFATTYIYTFKIIPKFVVPLNELKQLNKADKFALAFFIAISSGIPFWGLLMMASIISY